MRTAGRLKIAVAVVEDVGDGEVVAEGGDDEREGGKENGPEEHYTCPARSFTDTIPLRIILVEESEQASAKAVDAQREGEQQGKTTNLRHVGRTPKYFFRKRWQRQPHRWAGPSR